MRRRSVVWSFVLFGVSLLSLSSAACSPGNAQQPATTPTPDGDGFPEPSGYRLLSAVSDLVAEPMRFPFVILAPDGGLVEDADVTVAFLRVIGEEDAEIVARDVPTAYRVLETEEPHPHDDGSTHLHVETLGIYVVDEAPFDAAGRWIVSALVNGVEGTDAPFEVSSIYDVKETSATPALGAPAPRTDTPTAADVADLAEISSRQPPLPEMYQSSIAEAVTSSQPSVIAFTTPAYCQSRLCGPVLESAVQIMPEYQDRVRFVHVEPYKLDVLRNGGGFELVPAATEWGLPSEPWVFVVDAQGNVAAKFEGVVTADELKAALDRTLAA